MKITTAPVLRVTGSWTRIVLAWLDQEALTAPELRSRLLALAPGDQVPLAVWRDLLAKAVSLRAGRPGVGLAIGACVQPEHVGVLGYLVVSSDTIGEAMAAYQRYERLFYGVAIAEAQVCGEAVEVRWPPTELGQVADTVGIAALVRFLQRQIDAPLPLIGVSFIHPAPVDAEAYDVFFQCPVSFADTHTRVRFPVAFLAQALRQRDAALRELLDRQARAALLAMPDDQGFDRALRQVLLRLLPEGRASLPEVAKQLHVSVRTLQRRMESRERTWQDLLDRMREHLAQDYLRDLSLSLSDIALLLGYSEQSAFTRAFQRWTGTSPARWRRQQRGG